MNIRLMITRPPYFYRQAELLTTARAGAGARARARTRTNAYREYVRRRRWRLVRFVVTCDRGLRRLAIHRRIVRVARRVRINDLLRHQHLDAVAEVAVVVRCGRRAAGHGAQ